jgi:hypothetical protein
MRRLGQEFMILASLVLVLASLIEMISTQSIREMFSSLLVMAVCCNNLVLTIRVTDKDI